MHTANVAPPVTDREHIAPFLGSWDLVSFEHVLPAGEASQPFGNSPVGLLVYQADGRMSAQLSTGSPTKLSSDDSLEVSIEEAAGAWRSYFGYWGWFKVCAEDGVVVHRVQGSSFANWIGTDQARHFRFDGANRLILETESASGRYTLTWQRTSS
ncbi:MAG: lipocalin-like domain-containing protein [Acidobacteriaceae bacterium]|nr:lipocalin-like domain-containing protein [Acidobacteriaceae bacterium]